MERIVYSDGGKLRRMLIPGRLVSLLLLCLVAAATSSPVSSHTHAPLLPPSASPPILPSLPPPSPPPLSVSTSTEPPEEEARCPMKVSPPVLVVRFGDPVSVNCSVPGKGFPVLGWEVPLGAPPPTMAQYLLWHVDRMTEWSIKPTCYALSELGGKCDIDLSVTVYKPPDRVSVAVANHSGPMLEGARYTLQCTVQDVAPLDKLAVTFYRGQDTLAQLRSNSTAIKTPVTEVFRVDIRPGRQDDGADYWCEARLELGPEGPPVVTSQTLSTAVLFGPQLGCPAKLRVREGESLQCEVAGNPRPVVTWYRDGQAVALPARSDRMHAGKYIIWTQGLLGQKNFTVEVEVLENGGTPTICSQRLIAAVLLQTIFWL